MHFKKMIETFYLYRGQDFSCTKSMLEVRFLGERFILKQEDIDSFTAKFTEKLNLISTDASDWVLMETIKGNIIKKIDIDIGKFHNFTAFDLEENQVMGQIDAYIKNLKTMLERT